MSKPTSIPDELERLKRDRDEYDRRYNDALSTLDRATIRAIPEVPPPPPVYDDHQITPINRLWQILPGGGLAFGEGWRGRLRRFIWRFIGPLFDQQQQFNAALVDHINRNAAIPRGTGEALHVLIPLVASQIEALAAFESRLVQWAQEITGYVDTKDRDVSGRLNGRVTAIEGRLDDRVTALGDRVTFIEGRLDGRVTTLGHRLTTGLEAVTDVIQQVTDVTQKRWESMLARERRQAARGDELTTTLAVLQQASLTLKRELERLMSGASTSVGTADGQVRPSPGASTRTSSLDAYKYVGFEDKFRGSQEEIRARLVEYVPDFEGASDVLDAGCGRGEFLDLLRERGIAARGVDVNHEMVEVCRARGFDVVEGDALGYLETLPDQALGGLFAAQVVEHLEPDYLLRFLETAYHKLRPGSKVVLETINPACWYAFFESYVRDLTHVRPLHPDTLVYLLVANGFQRTDVRYCAPFPEASKLQPVQTLPLAGGRDGGDELAALVATVNENTRKLNGLLFTHLDYAAIGERI